MGGDGADIARFLGIASALLKAVNGPQFLQYGGCDRFLVSCPFEDVTHADNLPGDGLPSPSDADHLSTHGLECTRAKCVGRCAAIQSPHDGQGVCAALGLAGSGVVALGVFHERRQHDTEGRRAFLGGRSTDNGGATWTVLLQNVPGWIRTSDLPLRRRLLYPAELRAPGVSSEFIAAGPTRRDRWRCSIVRGRVAA